MNNTFSTSTDCSASERAWPSDRTFFLTIDYECDYGTALAENSYDALDHTEVVVDFLERLDIPLTCFVQTEVLNKAPEEVERLRNAAIPISFHAHSHTHRPREAADIEAEIRTSAVRYEDFFGRNPTGYRFPNGNVRPLDYQILGEYGYEFDASVFPSWRPGQFNNTTASTNPQYLPAYDLYEFPFTVYSDRFRIPTALSYCRLLGQPFTELLCRRPPHVVIFNIHMHDLINPQSFERLSRLYRGIYSRNENGLALLESVLRRFTERGFSFARLDELHDTLCE